jgi:hypothetical protein
MRRLTDKGAKERKVKVISSLCDLGALCAIA